MKKLIKLLFFFLHFSKTTRITLLDCCGFFKPAGQGPNQVSLSVKQNGKKVNWSHPVSKRKVKEKTRPTVPTKKEKPLFFLFHFSLSVCSSQSCFCFQITTRNGEIERRRCRSPASLRGCN